MEDFHENTLQNNNDKVEKNNTQQAVVRSKNNVELLQKANKRALRQRNKDLEKQLEATVVDMQDVSLSLRLTFSILICTILYQNPHV